MKKKKAKTAPRQRHIGESAELEGGGVFSGKKNFYKGANRTKNFIRVKTGNGLYYRGEKHYSPKLIILSTSYNFRICRIKEI
jgi:hypothetical protein